MTETWRCEKCRVAYRLEDPPYEASHSYRHCKRCEVPGCKVAYQERRPSDGTHCILYLAESAA